MQRLEPEKLKYMTGIEYGLLIEQVINRLVIGHPKGTSFICYWKKKERKSDSLCSSLDLSLGCDTGGSVLLHQRNYLPDT